MTTEQLYKRALERADEAYADFKSTTLRIREGRDIETAANTALNHLISMCWQLKTAAMDKEPAPLPKRPAAKKGAAKRDDSGAIKRGDATPPPITPEEK